MIYYPAARPNDGADADDALVIMTVYHLAFYPIVACGLFFMNIFGPSSVIPYSILKLYPIENLDTGTFYP